jgi:hypothetical protein
MANLVVPSIQEPVVDLRTGKINPNWHKFLLELVRVVNAGL